MKYYLVFVLLFTTSLSLSALDGIPEGEMSEPVNDMTLFANQSIEITVNAMGVAPAHTTSPAQAYALAKRAAMVEGYRLIGERVKGVRVEGEDTVKNMIIDRTITRARMTAIIQNATVEESTFKDGMCEIEMKVRIYHNQFAQ